MIEGRVEVLKIEKREGQRIGEIRESRRQRGKERRWRTERRKGKKGRMKGGYKNEN